MKIQVLIENTALETGTQKALWHEHGLSLLIETGSRRILFDTGKSGRFAENADLLGADLSEVELLVLSHGHYDHGGGILAFLGRNPRAKIYIQARAFESHMARRGDGHLDDIGISEEIRKSPQVVLLSGDSRINENMMLFTSVKSSRFLSGSNRVLLMRSGPDYVQDTFAHEQNLLLTAEGKRVLISGCAHRGIVNIMERAMELAGGPPDAVIGGFHLSNPGEGGTEPEELVNGVADYLDSFSARYYTCHCTGLPAYRMLKERLGEKITYISAGMEFEL